MKINDHKDIVLECECSACPQTFNAFYDGEYIGYYRTRHGHLRICADADYPESTTVYSTAVKGDGMLDADEEDYHLNMGKFMLAMHYNNQ